MTSSGVKTAGTGAVVVTGIGGGGAVDSGAVVVVGSGRDGVGSGRDGVGGGDDMIETELADTKVVGTRVLPGLGRRLYGKEGVGRGRARGDRRLGTVLRVGGGGEGDRRRLGFRVSGSSGSRAIELSYCLISKRVFTAVYIIPMLIKIR